MTAHERAQQRPGPPAQQEHGPGVLAPKSLAGLATTTLPLASGVTAKLAPAPGAGCGSIRSNTSAGPAAEPTSVTEPPAPASASAPTRHRDWPRRSTDPPARWVPLLKSRPTGPPSSATRPPRVPVAEVSAAAVSRWAPV